MSWLKKLFTGQSENETRLINLAESGDTNAAMELADYYYDRGRRKEADKWYAQYIAQVKQNANTLVSDIDRSMEKIDEMQQQIRIIKMGGDFDSMDGTEFEIFCVDILSVNDFVNIERKGGSGDHGVDILAEKDGITYAIQCKRSAENIGNKAVQEVYLGKDFYRQDIAVVLTNQYFTANAKEAAKRTGVKLWDRDYLENLLQK